jgi:hypothetical protein
VSGHRYLLLVFAVLQAAAGVLAALGQLLFTGANPLYLIAPLGRGILLVTAASATAAGRRWGAVAVIVLEGLSVVGFWVSAAVGLLPWVDTTVNLVGLLANLLLPAAMVYLAARTLPVPAPRPAPVRVPAPTLFLPTEELR